MDHLDWFTPGSEEAETEIAHFHCVWRLLRSTAKPWYMYMEMCVSFSMSTFISDLLVTASICKFVFLLAGFVCFDVYF